MNTTRFAQLGTVYYGYSLSCLVFCDRHEISKHPRQDESHGCHDCTRCSPMYLPYQYDMTSHGVKLFLPSEIRSVDRKMKCDRFHKMLHLPLHVTICRICSCNSMWIGCVLFHLTSVGNYGKRLPRCSRLCFHAKQTVSWCKGSTRDFDSLCLGSNPGETTTFWVL